MPDTTPAGFDPDSPYHLTEVQHTALYQARHLCELLSVALSLQAEHFTGRSESLAVAFGLVAELLDATQPNLVWRAPQ